ncbi:MAG: tetratricopeptide repeat protein [Gemmatimonadetes bacterium]|nr:tetratricopeptide repeat protein [Gemmatimonadota bacterium]
MRSRWLACAWLSLAMMTGAPDAGADVLLEARQLVLAGDREGARALLEEQLRKTPDNPDVHLTYAFVRGALGERAEVRSEYVNLLRSDPDNPVYAVTMLSVSPPSQFVTRMFARLLEKNPEFAPGWEEWGRYHLVNWNPAEAVPPLERAIALAPGRTRSLLYLGLAHRTMGDFMPEFRYLSQAFQADSLDAQIRAEWAFTILDRGDPELALRVVNPLLDGAVDDDYPFVIAAAAYAQLGETDRCEARKREAEERNPNLLRDILHRGIQFRNVAQGREAERMFRLALDLDPNFEPAAVQLGVLLMNRGWFPQARETFERLVRTPAGSTDAVAWKHLGACAAEMGDQEDALASFDTALAIDPGLVGARAERARALTRLDRFEEAADEWERVIDRDPRGWIATEARRSIGYLRKGEAPPPIERRNEVNENPATAR